MKKKLRDCTYADVRRTCANSNNCDECPLFHDSTHLCGYPPSMLLEEDLDLEIDIPEDKGMKKYRKKPIIIEAYRTDVEMDIDTLEGVMHASKGDYIITGVNGEKYPCKPDIFEKTYELVEEE